MRPSQHADAILLQVKQGTPIPAILNEYGKAEWNAAVLVAAAENGMFEQTMLADMLAHKETAEPVLAKSLVLVCAQAVAKGEDPHMTAAGWVEAVYRKRLRQTDLKSATESWLNLAVRASQRMKQEHTGKQNPWIQADMIDHLLAILEPLLGEADSLRAWACSQDCALPNTRAAFRRGKLRWEAAKARATYQSHEHKKKQDQTENQNKTC